MNKLITACLLIIGALWIMSFFSTPPLHSVLPVKPDYKNMQLVCLVVGLVIFLVAVFELFSAGEDSKASSLIGFISAIIFIVGFMPLCKWINTATEQQYEDIRLHIQNKPNLIQILPNYVDEDCTMTVDNYNAILSFIESKDQNLYLNYLTIKMPVNKVEAMCKNTVFKIESNSTRWFTKPK
jgi:hypothetical protein